MPATQQRDVSRRIRNVSNVVNLSTPLGLVLAAVGRGRLHLDRDRRVAVADDVRLPLVTAGAMTVGDVVLVMRRTAAELEARNPRVMDHEEQHAWQWAYCFGLPFLPLYFAMMGWSTWRTGDRASFNFFEQQAGLEIGGYKKKGAKARKRKS